MKSEDLMNRIIETADEYHAVAEEQWLKATELEPANDADTFEFRRLLGVALGFYCRAFLVLGLVETDDDQDLADVLEIAADELPELAELIEQNNGFEVLDEESGDPLSRVFSVAEVIRTLLLQQSNQRAATLHKDLDPE